MNELVKRTLEGKIKDLKFSLEYSLKSVKETEAEIKEINDYLDINDI